MNYKEIDGKLYFNVSDNLINFSQRNNEYVDEITNKKIANSMCNVTSYCMAATYNGFKLPKSSIKYLQEEDAFLEFIRTNRDVLNYYKNSIPEYCKVWRNNEKDNYPPEQIHTVLCYAFNKWIKSDVAKFNQSTKIDDIILSIMDGLAVVLSGKFGKLNHIVTLVGFTASKDILNKKENLIDYIEEFIIDDPYGDFRGDYKTIKGNDIKMTKDDFISIFKPINDRNIKMAHLFKKPVATV